VTVGAERTGGSVSVTGTSRAPSTSNPSGPAVCYLEQMCIYKRDKIVHYVLPPSASPASLPSKTHTTAPIYGN